MRANKENARPLTGTLTPALWLLLALASSCMRTRVAEPASHVTAKASAADAAFMRAMIGHHAQALSMTSLVGARTTSADIRTLAERIDRSQRDEIALMARWLGARDQQVPDTTHLAMGHYVAGQHAPGMLTAEQLDELRAARGVGFDRLFLTFMIQHHRGAVEMVRSLLASLGGGQDPEAYRFAADVDADQRAEIARMQRMLDARGPQGSPQKRD